MRSEERMYLGWSMDVTECCKFKSKPKGSKEAACADQINDVAPPAKSSDAAAGDKPPSPLPHTEQHALQEKCWSVIA